MTDLVATAHPAPHISIKNVSVRFPGVLALDRVSLDVPAGELHAIVGENGAGKSTLMKILASVHTDYDGIIRIDGRSAALTGVREPRRRGLRSFTRSSISFPSSAWPTTSWPRLEPA